VATLQEPVCPAHDETFDRLAGLLAKAVQSSAAFVSLADRRADEIVFAGITGVPEIAAGQRMALSQTICRHVVASGTYLAIPDTDTDPLARSEATIRELGIGAYLGVPLVTPEGEVIGVLCSIDRHPRAWSVAQIELAQGLAAAVMTEIGLRNTIVLAAREADERRAIVASALDCIVTMDGAGIVRDFNPAAERTFGYRREDAVGRRLGDLIVPPELRRHHEQGLRRYLETGEQKAIGRRLKLDAMRADGSTLPVELTIAQVDGEQPLFVGFIRDLSDVVAAESELRAAEARYRGLVEQLPLMTYITSCDEPPTTSYVSPQAETLLGYPSEDWLSGGSPFFERIVHPDDLAGFIDERSTVRQTRGEFSRSYRLLAADGRIVWVLDESRTIQDADGVPLFCQGFLVDITERKLLEEQLRQSQKMEAIGQLAGGIAHDFNNMLTAISGYAELIGYTFEEGDPRLDDIGELKRATGHAAGLTRQLLAFSRKQTLLRQRLDANEIVAELEPMLRRTIGAEVTIALDLEEGLPPVETDPDQLAQVVLNIAINARDAMPDGGSLSISTSSLELAGVPHVAITVTDNGTGMDEVTREHIFEPFFTTKETGKGTGLGLATVYGVVSQSGGTVEVETQLGVGSTFRVLLPQAVSPVAA
jgi:PAS domain S-box-containing protein